MTVIYSVSVPTYAIQVGDRRVTRGGEIQDEEANKGVVYLGPDGLISISYTGLAFVKGVPTDEWLVSTITGATDLVVDGRTPTHFGPIPRHPDVGHALELVREGLTSVMPSLDPGRRRLSLELDAVGWQWRRDSGCDLRRLLWNLKAEAGHGFTVTRAIPRRGPRKVYLSSIGDDQLSDAEFRELAATAEANDADLDATEDALASAVELVAGRSCLVGPDSTAVAMPYPTIGWARVRFRSPSPATAMTTTGDLVEVGFVPWIVGGGLIAPPSAVIGQGELVLGSFRIRFDGPRPDSGLLAAWSSQPRRRE